MPHLFYCLAYHGRVQDASENAFCRRYVDSKIKEVKLNCRGVLFRNKIVLILQIFLFIEIYKLSPGYSAVHAHCRFTANTVLGQYSSSRLLKSEFAAPIVEVANDPHQKSEETLNTFVDFITESIWKCIPDPTYSKLLRFRSTFEKAVKDQVLQSAEHRKSAVNILKEIL